MARDAHRAVLVTTEPPGAGQHSAPSGSCPHPKHGSVYPQSMGDQDKRSRSPRCATPRRQRDLEEGGGGRTNISVSPPRSVPALTHSALCHRPVPVGPRPRASSRPHHRIPGGWAESGCKTHSAQRRVPTWGGGGREGEGEGHPRGGVRERGATHRSGDSCSALALCRGDPTPPTAPAHNGRQRYGDGHRLAPSKPGPRATPAPCNAGVCAALLLVQRWHPGKVGVRATLEPMRRICATLVPVQIWLSCIAGLHAACRTGAHAKLLPCSAAVLCQHWHSCTAGVHANAGTQCTTVTHMQRWCPCNTSSHAMLLPTPGIPATFLCNTTPAQQPVQQQHRQHCDVQPRPTAAHRGSQTCSPADPLHPHSSMQRRPPCPPHDPAAIGATHCSSPPGISWSPWCPRNPRGPGSCVARPRCPVGTQRGGQRGHGGLGVSGTGRSGGGGARVSLPGRAPPWLCSPPRCVPALSPAAPCPALRCAGEERRH